MYNGWCSHFELISIIRHALKIFCQLSQNLQIQFIRLNTCQWSWSCGAVRVNGSPTLVNGHAGHVNGCAARINGHVILVSGRATLVDARAIRVELIVNQDLSLGLCFFQHSLTAHLLVLTGVTKVQRQVFNRF